jgi:hypothetical protein
LYELSLFKAIDLIKRALFEDDCSEVIELGDDEEVAAMAIATASSLLLPIEA